MKPFRLAAFAIAILLAACTSSPTDPARLDSAAPSFDEVGAGNNPEDASNGSSTTEQGGNTVGSGNFNSDSTQTESARGGNGMGSGN